MNSGLMIRRPRYCEQRPWETHLETVQGRRTHMARQLARDVSTMSIRDVSRRYGVVVGFHRELDRRLGRIWWARVVACPAAGFWWWMRHRCARVTSMWAFLIQ